jgi:HEAT repeat protein
MRRNVVLILVLLAFLAIAGLLLFQPKQTPSQSPLISKSPESSSNTNPAAHSAPADLAPAPPAGIVSDKDADTDSEPTSQAMMANSDPKTTNDSSADTPEARHQAFVDARTIELMDLAMNDDSQSLNTILSELNNRDPEVRKAAVEAAVQFGSRDAIPNLMDAAAQTDDPKEKAEIMEAIHFLKSPTLSEAAAQAKAASKPATQEPTSSKP